MLVIPAIDLKEGKVVRLFKGEFDKETIYSENPVDVAKGWVSQGASLIHLVDLDGARLGRPQNLEAIKNIVRNVDVSFELGGGIRNIETIREILGLGIDRVILGSAALYDQDLIEKALEEFSDEKIIVGIDAKDGMVATKGWIEVSEEKAVDLALRVQSLGIKEVIYTDISRDGTLVGPNFKSTKELAEKTTLKIIASGGVSNLDDIERLKSMQDIGIKGVITGKALYDKRLSLREAIGICSNIGKYATEVTETTER
ncbi:1-(5-phosphoribosyl)-5-[(5-phosphoribosylamino)methylideneamino]imidazole-4-carboxamide isomerase [bacterium]|nr:1-(5-phosphoribosyl)-5-[(5-phosphoribosylamino)methylideneamino]imidazole-4-carboxamide isomerase [bacterium]